MLQGDIHRLYLRLRRRWPDTVPQPLPPLTHVREIATYYAKLSPADRRLLLAWAKKEESGIGLIPAALSGIPLLGLMFAPFIQETVRRLAPSAWKLLWLAGCIAFISGIYVHHRQKAFTTLHVHLLEELCRSEQLGEPGKS